MVMLVPGPVAVLDLDISEWLGLLDPSIVGEPKYLSSKTLRLGCISALRVRDIKLRLSRSHGFRADEIGQILDKRELVHILIYEENNL